MPSEPPILDHDPQPKSKDPFNLTLQILFWLSLPILAYGGFKAYASWIQPAPAHHARYIDVFGSPKSALETFKIDNGRYPTTDEGLQALMDCPPGLENTWHKQLDKLPTDQWSRVYRYTLIDADHNEIRSAGVDRIFGTADDVVSPEPP